MGPLVVLIGILYMRSGMARSTERVAHASRWRWARLVPLFVVGFIAMAALNSLGVFPKDLTTAFSEASKALILVALVGVGLNTNVTQMRAVGWRPLQVGFLAAACLSLFALGLGALILGTA